MTDLEIGRVYKSPAGCPVQLLGLYDAQSIWRHWIRGDEQIAQVKYIDEKNNYGYGEGAIGFLVADSLTAWETDDPLLGDQK